MAIHTSLVQPDAAARGIKLTEAGANRATELGKLDARLFETSRRPAEEPLETTLPPNALAVLDERSTVCAAFIYRVACTHSEACWPFDELA